MAEQPSFAVAWPVGVRRFDYQSATLDEVTYFRVKRAFDIVLSILFLPLAAPVILVCALLVKLSSPGPAMVAVPRVGRGGRRFTAFVLRTTPAGATAAPARAGLVVEHVTEEMIEYARSTAIGRVLRDSGLYELPLLLNVLRGEMSLVGPRPTSAPPESTPLWYTARLDVPPGLTGPWRLCEALHRTSERVSRLDVSYARERSIATDALILVRSLRCLGRIVGRFTKRAFDISASVVLLVLLSPLMAGVAIAIAWTSPGPVLFVQRRVGKHGRPFQIMKFRTMRVDAEEVLYSNPELYAEWIANDCKLPQERDPRVTPVGRWLRRTSLDELPQLFNVLMGDMSLVGPRPIFPEEEVHYGPRTPEFCSVLPGVTGAWQVTGRSTVHYPERCEIELDYVRSWSLARDAEILFRTIGTVVSRRGAE